MKITRDRGWKKCWEHVLFYHSKQPWDCCEISFLWGEMACSWWFLRIYCFASTNNFQRRQICEVTIYIQPRIITTVRLKILSRKHLCFMRTSLKDRLKETEKVKVKVWPLVSPDTNLLTPISTGFFLWLAHWMLKKKKKSKHTCLLFYMKYCNSCSLPTSTSRRQHGLPMEESRGFRAR